MKIRHYELSTGAAAQSLDPGFVGRYIKEGRGQVAIHLGEGFWHILDVREVSSFAFSAEGRVLRVVLGFTTFMYSNASLDLYRKVRQVFNKHGGF